MISVVAVKENWEKMFFSSVLFHWILSEAVTMDDVSFFQTFSLVVHWFLRWIKCHVMQASLRQWREGVRREKNPDFRTRIASGWVRWVSKNCCVVPAFLQSSAMLDKLQNSWQFVLVNHSAEKIHLSPQILKQFVDKGFQQHGTVCIFLQLYCRA